MASHSTELHTINSSKPSAGIQGEERATAEALRLLYSHAGASACICAAAALYLEVAGTWSKSAGQDAGTRRQIKLRWLGSCTVSTAAVWARFKGMA